MGGKLWVESEEGNGTRFIFELPLGYIDTEELELLPYKGSKVLLLESHQPCRVAEREYLEMLGFDVKDVDSDESFMAELDSSGMGYQLLVLAENDSTSSRLGLAREIRQRLKRQGTPKILHLTFFDGADDPALFDGVLHKPLDGQHLRSKLDEILGGIKKQVAETEAMTAATGRLKILVAEDDAINAKVMTFFLRQKGHEVILASNGEEALGLLRQHKFDLGFLDMRMPEMDGLMVTREWRSEEKDGRRLPLIAVTANVTREDRAACFEAGMDDFVSKPVDPARLSELLDMFVQSKSLTS
jgi:CheY-like chemotaxis protein